jgi:hypothetical protein
VRAILETVAEQKPIDSYWRQFTWRTEVCGHRLFFCDETRLDPSDLRGEALGALAADTTTLEAERAIRFRRRRTDELGKSWPAGLQKRCQMPVVENPQLLSVELPGEKLANYRNDTNQSRSAEKSL